MNNPVFQMVLTTSTIIDEVANRNLKRKDVAMSYRLAMESSHPTDWGKVNRAIIERWSESGLMWIKRQAHSGRCFSPAEPREEVE